MSRWLWWVRRDLRLEDNSALSAAAGSGEVIPVYIHADPETSGLHAPWRTGSASAWWLHHSLVSLDAQLRRHGSRLVIRQGEHAAALAQLVRETKADGVAWNRIVEPAQVELDRHVRDALHEVGVDVDIHEGHLLHEPTTLLTKANTGYRVFTPFWKTLRRQDVPAEPLPRPALTVPRSWPASETLESLKLLPKIDWTHGLTSHWTPGEIGAQTRLQNFTDSVTAYDSQRDLPDEEGTSSISPHLHFGELSSRQAWWAALRAVGSEAEPWLRQLAWREFAHHLLWHEPATIEQPLRPEFERFAWEPNPRLLRRWQRGRTGYPIVDAGMRQLWETGWMHNRVRMIVASFLVKDLLQPWQDGAAWFWDTLVDADLANNTMGWQWTAGCGADAAPFFRIFNPTTQGKRFDPEGGYVRHWVPEISGLSNRWVHEPWNAPADERAAGGICDAYPAPIVDHKQARERALSAYRRIKSTPSS
jgi:deoxyribodipyrimidine photo-lyase